MVQRRNHSHERILATNPCKHADRTDLRDYDPLRRGKPTNPGKRPSLEFDWDTVIPRIDKMLAERNDDA